MSCTGAEGCDAAYKRGQELSGQRKGPVRVMSNRESDGVGGRGKLAP
jgi:hypothetical protein